jgi:flagellar hook assembly protein FlgD
VQEINTSLLPQKFELGQNTPNPFNPNTVIVFAVPRPAEVRIEVFNVLGQKVKTLSNEFSKAGYKRVEWDGTDDSGSSVASGVYLYRMISGDFSDTKKMLLLK